MLSIKLNNNVKPQLIFCKDINSAKTLYALLAKTHPDNLQLYTGGDNEAACVTKAALGGMITVCTAAIGRNTDILYNRAIGMDVMHTAINSYNLEAQLTGRTGRQGSSGNIDFYFNEKELGKKTKADIQHQIYENSLKDRAFNEEIYTLLGNVLMQIEQLLPEPGTVDFLNNTWATLSIKYESHYKELKIDNRYDRESFVNQLAEELSQFNLNKQEILDALTQQFQAKAPYNPYTAPVKLKDSIPPVELAYALLNKPITEKPMEPGAKQELKNKVNDLLNTYKNAKKSAFHADYIRYLTKSHATQDEIRTIHQDCIEEFLKDKAKESMPWYKRLLGIQSMLSKVTNSSNYLILFKSLTNIPSSTKNNERELMIAKDTTIALLKEYQSFWFIHAKRVKMVQNLITKLESIPDLASMITVLDDFQTKLAKQDTEINKGRRWFPLHRSGSSRLQNTLSSALNLASSLHHQTTDNYKKLVEKFDETDKNNQTVIKKQIKTASRLREHHSFFPRARYDTTEKDQNPHEDDLGLDDAMKKIT